MNTNSADLWLVLLCVAATMTTVMILGGMFFAWRKRSNNGEDAVPHCNLQERLAQIANTPMVKGMKLALLDPVVTSKRN
jgi:hypothetical protein